MHVVRGRPARRPPR